MHTIFLKVYLITSVTDVNNTVPLNPVHPYYAVLDSILDLLFLRFFFIWFFAAVRKKWRDCSLLNEKLDFTFHFIVSVYYCTILADSHLFNQTLVYTVA